MTQVFEFAAKGGILMIPLAICSVISLTIILEKLFNQKYDKMLPKEVISKIDSIRSFDEVELHKSGRQKYRSPLSPLIDNVLDNANKPMEEIKEELVDETRQEVRVLDRGLTALEIIATITPVIGLLGTVIGMIKVFKAISQGGIADPSALSAGISEALITTATGLTIAIPTLIMFHYFKNRNKNILLDMEEHLNRLLRKLKLLKEGEKNENRA